MSIIAEMAGAQVHDLPLSEELRAGARALIERSGPLVLSADEVGELGRFLWAQADQAARMENSIRALACEIAEEAALPASNVRRIPMLGKVS